MGNNHDKALGTAFDYLEYLGTSDMTPEELKSEFYRLACTFYVSPGNERTYVVLSGLNENMPAAVQFSKSYWQMRRLIRKPILI